MKQILACALLAPFFAHAVFSQQSAPAPAPAQPPLTPETKPKSSESVNAAILQAREATKDKRFADSEALMQKVTTENPHLILPWMELGLAQIGLKKYPDAEKSFKVALGLDPASVAIAHSNDFYQQSDDPHAVAASATHASRNGVGGVANNGDNRTPEIKGVAYSSLGEVYIREGKVPEAEQAFDAAAEVFPAQAPLYRRNETIFFFQVGNSDAQLNAANKAIAIDPTRAMLYYFKGQALVSKATIDPKTQKMMLPPGCAEAYQKYLDLEPTGQFSADAKGVLTGAGIAIKPGKK